MVTVRNILIENCRDIARSKPSWKKNTRESRKALFSTDLGLVKSVLKKQKYNLLKITMLFWVLKEYLASP